MRYPEIYQDPHTKEWIGAYPIIDQYGDLTYDYEVLDDQPMGKVIGKIGCDNMFSKLSNVFGCWNSEHLFFDVT